MNHFRSVLVHVDSRLDDHPVLDRAIQLAQDHGCTLTIVDVVPDFTWPLRVASGDYKELQKTVADKKHATMFGLLEKAQEKGVNVTGKVLFGKASVAIISEVERSKHDLVMKAAKGPGSRRSGFFGTTATRLMRSCPCTVWAYRPQSGNGERVAAAVDPTAVDQRHADLNRSILEVAIALSGENKPHVIHAWHVYSEKLIHDYMKREDFEALVRDSQQESRAKLAELIEPLGMSLDDPEVHMLHGSEEDSIATFVNDGKFDILVMGTVGRSGISGFLIGNTAEILLDRIECSIVAVKNRDLGTSV